MGPGGGPARGASGRSARRTSRGTSRGTSRRPSASTSSYRYRTLPKVGAPGKETNGWNKGTGSFTAFNRQNEHCPKCRRGATVPSRGRRGRMTYRGDSRLDSGNHLLKRLSQLYESERHDAIDPASLYTPPWLSPRMPLLPHNKDRQTALHWQASLSA